MKNYFSHKKVLVTGAGGFIGSYICEELENLGADVTGIVRNKKKAQNLQRFAKKIKIVEADLLDVTKIKSLIKTQTIIIHAAAVDGGTLFKRENAKKIFHDNFHINRNLFESLKKGKVKKLLYISTAEVYSNLTDKKNVKEGQFSLFSPSLPEHWYAFSKIMGEYSAQLIGQALGIDVIIVRPANIYGPRDDTAKNRLVPTLLQAIKEQKKEIILGGTGQDIRSFIYVTDYVKNILSLLEHSKSDIYNIAGRRPITIEQFVRYFSKHAKIKITFNNSGKVKDTEKNIFLLNSNKAKKYISPWHDSLYEKRIKEIIKNI